MTPTEFIQNVKMYYASQKSESEAEYFRKLFGFSSDEEKNKDELLYIIAERVSLIFSKESSLDEYEALIAKYKRFEEEDFCHQLLTQYRSLIPEQYVKMLDNPNLVDYGLVEDDKPYCIINEVEEHSYAILMSQGLQRILYASLRSFCAYIHITNSEIDSAISINELRSILLDNFFVFKYTYSILPREDVEVTPEQIILANRICVYSELFFLLHEFSHILIAIESDNDNLLPKEEEFLADSLALTACMNMGSSIEECEIVFLGCTFGLLMFKILEEMSLYQIDQEHPSFNERISNLKTELHSACNDIEVYNRIANFSSIAETVFDRIDFKCNSEYENKFKLNIDSEIETLLCLNCFSNTNNYLSVPNYEDFCNDMWMLFLKGHYESIYDILLKYAKESVAIMNQEEYSDSMTEYDKIQYVTAFNKFKLIYKFTHILPDPIADIFIPIYELALKNEDSLLF